MHQFRNSFFFRFRRSEKKYRDKNEGNYRIISIARESFSELKEENTIHHFTHWQFVVFFILFSKKQMTFSSLMWLVDRIHYIDELNIRFLQFDGNFLWTISKHSKTKECRRKKRNKKNRRIRNWRAGTMNGIMLGVSSDRYTHQHSIHTD